MNNDNRHFMPQIQALRGFAALCVVLTHAFLGAGLSSMDGGLGPHPQIGEFGVDIFFVISGFIMVVISHNDFGKKGIQLEFLKKRLARIVPLYWMLTGLLIGVILIAPGLIANPDVDLVYWVKSLLFVPVNHPSGDGLRPVLVVGWTLQFEMFFYGLFAIALFFPRRFGLSLLLLLLIGIAVLGKVFAPQGTIAGFFSASIILEFAAGICLAVLYTKGVRLPRVMVWLLPLVALVVLAVGWRVSAEFDVDRVLFFGLPATILMAGLTLSKGVEELSVGVVWRRLGDSSYALYLSHVFVIAGMGYLFEVLGSADWQLETETGVVFIIVSLIVSCYAGWLLHAMVEQPVARLFKSKFEAEKLNLKNSATSGQHIKKLNMNAG